MTPKEIEQLEAYIDGADYAPTRLVRTLLADYKRQSEEIKQAFDEIEDLKNLCDRLKLEAQGHAMEARTANQTVYECYQAVTGGKGEPGNWNGANPVREYVARQSELLEEARNGIKEAFEEGFAAVMTPCNLYNRAKDEWPSSEAAVLLAKLENQP